MKLKVLQFVVVVLLALALAPVVSHLLSLPNKMDLPQRQYFTAQTAYDGWGLPTGIVLVSAILATLALTVATRGRGPSFTLALTSFVCISATLAVFFIWTFPTNQVTLNWTVVPADWEALRAQWEYSHAVNAGLTFVALCAAVASTLAESKDSARRRETADVG